jgi:hypothetical protein
MERCPRYDGAGAAFTFSRDVCPVELSQAHCSKKNPFVMQTHLFLLRLWCEELGQGTSEWRGRVVSLESGEARYFRDTATLYAVLHQILSNQADLTQFLEGTTQASETVSTQSSHQDPAAANSSSQSTLE